MLHKEQSGRANSSRLFYLDWIRILASFLIVIYHFPINLAAKTDWLHATVANGGWGNAVVYVFFMISGAALFYRYGKDKEFAILPYLKKRFLAIYPLFYIAYIAAFFIVFWILGRTYTDVPSYAIIWSILGLDGYLHDLVPNFFTVGEWFIGAIILVYLCFPVLRFIAKRNGTGWLLCLLALPAVYFMLFPSPFGMEAKKNLFIDLFFFMAGAWLEECRGKMQQEIKEEKETDRENEGRSGFWHWHGKIMAASIIGLLFLLVWLFSPKPLFAKVLSFAQGKGQNLTDSFAAISMYLFLLSAADAIPRLFPLAAGVISRLAGYTYGVFLIHHFVESRICSHFDESIMTNRDRLVLLLLCLTGVAIATVLLYRAKMLLTSFLFSENSKKSR